MHHQFGMVRAVFMVIDKVTQANQLRVIGNSETFSATTRYISPKKVEAVFSVRRDAKSPRYEKKTMFDFGGVSDEQLHLLAMYGAKVKLQAILRALSPVVMLNSQTLAVVDVQKDLLDVEKASETRRLPRSGPSRRPLASMRPLLGRCSSKPRPKQRQTSRNRRSNSSLIIRHNTRDQRGLVKDRPFLVLRAP